MIVVKDTIIINDRRISIIRMLRTMLMGPMSIRTRMKKVQLFDEENHPHDNHDAIKLSNESICSRVTWSLIVLFHHAF